MPSPVNVNPHLGKRAIVSAYPFLLSKCAKFNTIKVVAEDGVSPSIDFHGRFLTAG